MEIITKSPLEKRANIFSQMVFRFLPYWPLFLILMIVSAAGAWCYIHFTTPEYEASAKLLLSDEKKGAEESKTIESLDALSSKKIVENELEVIQSRTLINKVVENLYLTTPVFIKEKFRTISGYNLSPIQIEAAKGTLVQKADIFFAYNNKVNFVQLKGKQYPLNNWVQTPYGNLRFSKNENYKPAAISNLKLFFRIADVKSISASIAQRIKVSAPNKLSSIIDLTFTDEVPQRAENILNQLLEAYKTSIVQYRNTLANNTLTFIENRLAGTTKELDSIEKKIQAYRSSRGAIDISTQGRLFLENVSTNDQKLGDINMQLAVLQQVQDYVDSKNNSSGIVPSTLGINDPTLSQLVDKLYTSELEYEQMKKTTGENSPIMVSVKDRIDKIKPSIIENIQSQRSSLMASKSNLSATNNGYSSMLQTIPQKERELIDINREQGIKNEIYNFLLQRREETALALSVAVTDTKIIDNAEASDMPISPKKKVVVLTAFLIALFSGMSVVFFKETFSRNIMFRHEIEDYTRQPIIGEISAESSRYPIVIGEDKKTFIAEQFRKLRITLNHIGINAKHKRLLVTSAISGEGKSFVATNLALSLALTGKKVVLLDFDLNNPSLNNKLNISEELGITDYLEGTKTPEEIIRQTDLHKNLYLIPTGALPSNPSELMLSVRTEELLNHLDGMFDYIVIDTAPVSPVTDAYILSPYCDATLFIIRHGYTPKLFVQRIDENNKVNKLNNVAIVFNGVRSRGIGSKNYGYGYGYGYIYQNSKDRKRLQVKS